MTIVIAIIVLSMCVAGLAIKILLNREGVFPITEVGANPKLRKLGLRCPKEEELQRWKPRRPSEGELQRCTTCTTCVKSCKKS